MENTRSTVGRQALSPALGEGVPVDVDRLCGNGSRADGKPLRGAALVRETIRDEIVAGVLPPGAPLASHLRLARRFGVSNITVQQALSQLAEQGFLDVRPRLGSFVVDRPPHLHNIGLVFPFDPKTTGQHFNWSKYYRTLSMVAADLQREGRWRLISFHGIDYHRASEDRQRLLAFIERRQLGGIVFANPVGMLEKTPIVEAPGLPRVELSAAAAAPWPVINLLHKDWLSVAFGRLAELGRRRVAMLFNRLTRSNIYDAEQIDRLVAERGMQCPPRWRQACEWHDTLAANHSVQLLMHGPEAERPDALIITDDNLIEGAIQGLIASGVRVPEDVDVIAEANFPATAAPALPLHLVGCDMRAALDCAIDLLDRQRRGEAVPAVTSLPPVWGENVAMSPLNFPSALPFAHVQPAAMGAP